MSIIERTCRLEALMREKQELKEAIAAYNNDLLMPEKNEQLKALQLELENLYKSLIYIPEIHTKARWEFLIESDERMLRRIHFWENDRRLRYEENIAKNRVELDKVSEKLKNAEETIKLRIQNVSDEIEAVKVEMADILENDRQEAWENRQEAMERLPELRHRLSVVNSDINLIDFKIVTMGNYYYDDYNLKKPVEWIVLDEQDGKTLLLSRYCIERKRFNERHREFTWADSDIRTWLNEIFIQELFTSSEQEKICATKLHTNDNKNFNVPGGEDTEDKLFFLSTEEALHYFYANNHRVGIPTPYAKSRGVYEYGGASWWWLRSPGANSTFAADIEVTGGPSPLGDFGLSYLQGIRPAMWVKL